MSFAMFRLVPFRAMGGMDGPLMDMAELEVAPDVGGGKAMHPRLCPSSRAGQRLIAVVGVGGIASIVVGLLRVFIMRR